MDVPEEEIEAATSCTLEIHILGQGEVIHDENNNNEDSNNNDQFSDCTSARIVLDDSFTSLGNAGLRELLEMLSHAPKIKEIDIERVTPATTSFSVAALTQVLQLDAFQHGLAELRLVGARLLGTREEWTILSNTIGQLQQLRYLSLVEPLDFLEEIPGRALDSLMRTCACSMPSLTFVATNLISALSLETIHNFCQSPYILGLHLLDMDVSKASVLAFLQELRYSNKKVWYLSMAFTRSLTTPVGKAMANLVRDNRKITNISIKSKHPLREEFLVEFAKGLADATLEELSLEVPTTNENGGLDLSASCQAALSDMLQQNNTLYSLRVRGMTNDDDGGTILAKEIDMYTRLNRAGRQRLFCTNTNCSSSPKSSMEDWVAVISHDCIRSHLDCLYHLLLKKPELLCSRSSKSPADDPSTLVESKVGMGRKRKYAESPEGLDGVGTEQDSPLAKKSR